MSLYKDLFEDAKNNVMDYEAICDAYPIFANFDRASQPCFVTYEFDASTSTILTRAQECKQKYLGIKSPLSLMQIFDKSIFPLEHRDAFFTAIYNICQSEGLSHFYYLGLIDPSTEWKCEKDFRVCVRGVWDIKAKKLQMIQEL